MTAKQYQWGLGRGTRLQWIGLLSTLFTLTLLVAYGIWWVIRWLAR